MNNFYLLSGKNLPQMASAFAPKEVDVDLTLDYFLNKNELPFELQLKKITLEKTKLLVTDDLTGLNNIWLDYQVNNQAWPVFSEKLKDIISRNLTGEEYVDWIATKINGVNEQRIYYIMRFGEKLDVLDKEKTLFVAGTDQIIKPYFSAQKIKNLSVFHKPSSHNLWKITPGIYVNEEIKKEITKKKLTGVSFEQTRVV